MPNKRITPPWKRGDLTDRIGNHMWAESIYEREVQDVLQVIERLRLRGSETQDSRPFYRLVHVRDGKAKIVYVEEYLKDVRRRAEKLAIALVRRKEGAG